MDPGESVGFAGVRGPAFAGREVELRTLLGAVTARPAVVMVEGEAGIGKSRRLQEARAHWEIAAALFLSTRTVENHVARALTELGTTRGGLAGDRA
ncbi:AAA family ATPase [Kitasatospora sp. NPDC059327]|uniref:AAA family ATPase n=1 Tax=Kitasatospora sp. NPDC059327 TaxID=3346803 RepID=UPI0036B3F5EE